MCLVIVYDNHTDFINDFKQLQKQYERNSDFIEITVKLNSISDVRTEIDFIKKQHLLTFTGFRSARIIKVSLKSSYGLKAVVTYRFKYQILYDELHKNLRLIEWK